MPEKTIQGNCISCGAHFPIDILEDDIQCPICGDEHASITAVCPHCGQEIEINGRCISTSNLCPICKKDFIWNTVKATDGSLMIVSVTGRIEMHDIASLVSVMQQELNEKEHRSLRNEIAPIPRGA